MKVKGTCGHCGREFLAEQTIEAGGRCPWCQRPLQADYAVVLTDALRDTERAGTALETALEKMADLDPRFELDAESVIGGIRRQVERLSQIPRSGEAKEASA